MNYRELAPGDVIKPGDQYFHHFQNEWVLSNKIGDCVPDKYSSDLFKKYRRPI